MKKITLFVLLALFCNAMAFAEINPITTPVSSLENAADVVAIDPQLVDLA
jgi:hypothetical protein